MYVLSQRCWGAVARLREMTVYIENVISEYKATDIPTCEGIEIIQLLYKLKLYNAISLVWLNQYNISNGKIIF